MSLLGYETHIIFHNPNFVNIDMNSDIYQNNQANHILAKNINANNPAISNNAVNLILNANPASIHTNKK